MSVCYGDTDSESAVAGVAVNRCSLRRKVKVSPQEIWAVEARRNGWGGPSWLTCDRLSVSGALPAGNEDDIALSGPHIVALEEEELVDAVVLESRNLDDGSDRAGEALLDDEVLLALNLSRRDRDGSMKLVHEPALP